MCLVQLKVRYYKINIAQPVSDVNHLTTLQCVQPEEEENPREPREAVGQRHRQVHDVHYRLDEADTEERAEENRLLLK